MKRVLAAAALAVAVAIPSIASASPAVISTAVNVRAGPGVDYPRIDAIARNVAVDVSGCIRDGTWCEVSWRGGRGWVSARYLDVQFQNGRHRIQERGRQVGVATIDFNLRDYWDANYRSRPFYAQRTQYERAHPEHAQGGQRAQQQTQAQPNPQNQNGQNRRDDDRRDDQQQPARRN